MTSTRFLATALVGAYISLQHAASLPAQQSTRQGLSLADFEKLHKELQPSGNELWRTIPWQVSIVEGRELAASGTSGLGRRNHGSHPAGRCGDISQRLAELT